MSVALKAVAWAWRFTQTVKKLPGTLETGELWLPTVQSNGESLYCLYAKIFVLILICELSIWKFCDLHTLWPKICDNFRLIALKLTHVDLFQDKGKKSNNSLVL